MEQGRKGRAPGIPTPTAHIQCCQVWPTSQPDPLVQSPLGPSLHEPGRAPVQLLEVAIGLKTVVASISHHHVAIRGQRQALWAVQRLCRCVDIRQEGARAVEHLGKEWNGQADEGLLGKGYSKNLTPRHPWELLTWMRLLPQSATMMFPLESTATPVGALNWPLPSPWEPNLKRNSPSALYTW